MRFHRSTNITEQCNTVAFLPEIDGYDPIAEGTIYLNTEHGDLKLRLTYKLHQTHSLHEGRCSASYWGRKVIVHLS